MSRVRRLRSRNRRKSGTGDPKLFCTIDKFIRLRFGNGTIASGLDVVQTRSTDELLCTSLVTKPIARLCTILRSDIQSLYWRCILRTQYFWGVGAAPKGLASRKWSLIMPQSHIAPRPSQIIYHLPCPGCGTEMRLARIEQTEKPDFDLCTFECAWCEHRQCALVKCE